jgi:hypothetical protein
VLEVGITLIVVVWAPVLQVYVMAPPAENVTLEPLHTEKEVGLTVKLVDNTFTHTPAYT